MRSTTAFRGLKAFTPQLQSRRFDIDTCPVRIAWPVDDRVIPFADYGRPLLDWLPRAELVRLQGVGPVPMYDDPALVAHTILDFTVPAEPLAS